MITDRSHTERKKTLSKGFALYQIYVAINLHFQKGADYDFIKYNGKVRGSIDKFNRSPAKHRYCAIARQFDENEFKATLYSLQKSHNGFIPERTITPKKLEQRFKAVHDEILAWKEKGLAEDIKSLKDDGARGWNDAMLADESGEAPLAIRKYLADEIDWKTLAHLQHNYNVDIVNKYKEASFFPIIKMAVDRKDEHLYFIGSLRDFRNRILQRDNIDWG